jgi:Heavy metal associated domain 2
MHRESEAMSQFSSTFKALFPQIDKIRTNAQTGSITVYYEREQVNFEEVLSQLQNLGILIEDPPKILSETSKAAANLKSMMAGLNQRVKQVTEGEVDLRFLIPLLFSLLALRQLFSKSPRLKTAPWYILAWYAFDSFLKLNDPPEKPSPKKQLPSQLDRDKQ